MGGVPHGCPSQGAQALCIYMRGFGSAPAYAPSQLEPKLHHDLVILSFCLCLSVRQYAREERKAEGKGKEETKKNVEGRKQKGERRKLMKKDFVYLAF